MLLHIRIPAFDAHPDRFVRRRVQVVGGVLRHGQNLSGIRIHHDADSAFRKLAGLNSPLNGLLRDVLDLHVQCEFNRVAVLCLQARRDRKRHLSAENVFRFHCRCTPAARTVRCCMWLPRH